MIRSAGNLICHGGDEERRDTHGDLLQPPMLAVVWYDAPQDCLRMERVSWEVAEALAPKQLAEIDRQLMAARAAVGLRLRVSGHPADVNGVVAACAGHVSDVGEGVNGTIPYYVPAEEAL
jgi:hypothetical protein